jgi:hypothetical protein
VTVSGSLIAMVLAAGSVSIDVEPGTLCVAAPSLSNRLEKVGLRVTTDAAMRVHVQRVGSQLEVRGTKNGRELRRAFVVRLASCASAEQLVATLVMAWSEELSVPPRVVVAPPPPEPKVPVNEPEPPPVVEVIPLAVPIKPRDEGAVARSRQVIIGVAPSEPVSSIPALAKDAETVVAERNDWLRSSFRANAMLLGGFNSGPTDAIAFNGQLEISARLRFFGLLLDGGLETARVRSGPVPIQSTQQWLSISALAVVSPADRIDLHLAVGFRAWRITAYARVPSAEETALSAPGAVVSIGASLAIWGPIRAHVRGFLAVRTRAERFDLVNYGTVMTLQPWQGGVLIGIDWRLL